MADFHFELDYAGVGELLKSPEMGAICAEYAESVKASYGDGAEVDVYTGANRVNAMVYQPAGRFDNALLKAVGEAAKND